MVPRSGLEQAIVAAVQQSSSACRGFLSVYIEPCPEDEVGSNWRVKGIKYGRANRDTCDAALLDIVRNLKERYALEVRHPVREEAPAPAPHSAPLGFASLASARSKLTRRS
jgi:hypothetical protein